MTRRKENKLYKHPKLPGIWDLSGEYFHRNPDHKIKHVKYSVYKNKYENKHNEAGQYVKKLAYNLTYKTVLISLPPGKLY